MNEKYLKLLSDDKLYDRKSLLFEEGKLIEIDDKFDNDKIMEGRLGEFQVNRVSTKLGVPLFVPVTKTNAMLHETADVVDEENLYQLSAQSRFLSLVKCSYGEAVKKIAEYEKNSNFITENNENYEDGLKEFIGLMKVEEYEDMLGIVSFIQKENVMYIFHYAGLGNFTDIRMENNNIVRMLYKRINR